MTEIRSLFSRIVLDVKAAISGLNRFNAEMDETSAGLEKTEDGTEKLGKDLDESGKKAAKFGRTLVDAFRRGGRAAFNARGKIKSSAVGIAKGLAVVTAGASAATVVVGGLTLAWAANSQELDNLSRRYQVSTDDIQAFTKALSLMGLDAEEGLEAIKELRIRLGEAKREGTTPLKEALTDLGINFDAFSALSLNDQLGVVADRLSEVEDASRKTALANDIAGEDLIRLIPFLDLQSEGMDRVIKRVKALNLIQSKESIAAGVKLQKSWKATIAILGSVRGLIATKLEPTFSAIIDTTREWVEANRPLITGKLVDFIERLVNVSLDFIPVAAEFLDGLLRIVEGLGGVDVAIGTVIGTMVTWKLATSALLGPGGPWLAGLAAVTGALFIFGKRVEAEDKRVSRLASRRLAGRGFRRRRFTDEELEAGGAPVVATLELEKQRRELIERSRALGVGGDVTEFRRAERARLERQAALSGVSGVSGKSGTGISITQTIERTVAQFKELQNQIKSLEDQIGEQVQFADDDRRTAQKDERTTRAAVSTEAIADDKRRRARVRELTEALRRDKITSAEKAELLGLQFTLGLGPIEGLLDAPKKAGAKKKEKAELTAEELVGLGPRGIKRISDLVPAGQGTTINNFNFNTVVQSPRVQIDVTPPEGTSPVAVATETSRRLGGIISDVASQDQRELVGQLQG